MTKVSLLLSHLMLPREGHLDAAVHVIAYVGWKYISRLVCNLSYPGKDHSVFQKCDWSEFYQDVKEVITVNAPEPRGKEVDIHMFVDNDHAGEKVFRRLRSDFLICMNTDLVQWH